MYKIALICQYGASTGMFAARMKQTAKKFNIEMTAKAYPDSQLESIIDVHDIILLGPQVGFKKDDIINRYPQYAKKIYLIDSVDFGMMNGEKVLKQIIKIMEENKNE